jgi:retron-type reverse transcriptase
LGNLSTPKSVQKLQKALHAKAKAEAGYRFYALYDKISREDILVHAYAQCRSNKGAPGVDGQEFADIEAYGVQRWLGELALALRQETYRPAPIRRVFIPKANGKLCIMHLVQFGFGDGEARRGDLATQSRRL